LPDVHWVVYNIQMPIDLNQLEELRKEKGLSQEKAAELCLIGGGRQGWSNLIHGRVKDLKVSQLEKIAKVFGVPINKLLR
jgi:transcriptional regulator with XRE-family HTH domain